MVLHAQAAAALTRYSLIGVRLPKPFSVMTKRSQSSRAMSMLMTSSPLRSRMPRTPEVLRPVGRTSLSWKRMACPRRLTMMMSSSPEVLRTAISSSPSRMSMAMMPSALSGVLYEPKSVFFTMPLRVPKMRNLPSVTSKLRVLMTAQTLLVLAQRQQVDDVLARGVAAGLGQLVHLEPVDLADAGEEQQEVVGAGDEEVLDLVLFFEVHAGDADAAALLLAVGGDRQALDVAGLGDGDHHLLLGDEVFDVDVALVGHDLGAAVVVVEALDLAQLALDDAVDGVFVAEQLAQLLDAREQAGVLFLDLVALEAGELLEPQVEDGLGLRPRELEGVHEGRRGRVSTSAARRMMR